MNIAKQFVELNKAPHDRKSFDCGKSALNHFLQQCAVRHRVAGISKTMVLLAADNTMICAYYTLSHTEIKRHSLPSTLAKKLPQYPVPVMLIAQLAVHRDVQGAGLGKITLIKALQHAYEVNLHLPSYAVVVDALDDEVVAFYHKYGFKTLELTDGRVRLFMPMVTIAQLFASA